MTQIEIAMPAALRMQKVTRDKNTCPSAMVNIGVELHEISPKEI